MQAEELNTPGRACLGEVHGVSKLGHLDDPVEDGLARRVAEALPRVDEPCRSLGRINALVKLLRPRTALPNGHVVVGLLGSVARHPGPWLIPHLCVPVHNPPGRAAK